MRLSEPQKLTKPKAKDTFFQFLHLDTPYHIKVTFVCRMTQWLLFLVLQCTLSLEETPQTPSPWRRPTVTRAPRAGTSWPGRSPAPPPGSKDCNFLNCTFTDAYWLLIIDIAMKQLCYALQYYSSWQALLQLCSCKSPAKAKARARAVMVVAPIAPIKC